MSRHDGCDAGIVVRVTEWTARYREGFVTTAGETVVLQDECTRSHGWPSPIAAMEEWDRRGDFSLKGTSRLPLGKRRAEDVSTDPRFAGLGVASIWQEITFEGAGAKRCAARALLNNETEVGP